MVESTRCGRPRQASLLVAVLLFASFGALQAGADSHENDEETITSVDHWVESHDGVELAVTMWYNATVERPAPVILGGHGWAGNRGDLEDRARWLVDEGYILLAWDARGFGESTGAVGLNGPDEWADVRVLIDWIADGQNFTDGPAVAFDGDDPLVGMIGNSYGGAIQFMAAAQDPRIDAIVPNVAWHDLVHSLAPETLVKRGWVDLLFLSGHAASRGLMDSPPHPNTGGMDERLNDWYLEATLTGRLPADAVDALEKRSPMNHLNDVGAHTLITQGYNDTLFLPDEAVANYNGLMGREDSETNLLFHTAGHGHSMTNESEEEYQAKVLQFLDRHLKDENTPALAPVLYADPADGEYKEADTWPPVTTETTDVVVSAIDGSDTITLLQAPVPTSTTDWQQFSGDYNGAFGPYIPEHQDASGETSVLLATDLDTTQPVHLAGRPQLNLTVTPEVDELSLFVSLVDTATNDVIYNQVTPVLIEGQNAETVDLEITLSSLTYTLDAGSALQVRVATSDLGFHGAREVGNVQISLDDALLRLPVAP